MKLAVAVAFGLLGTGVMSAQMMGGDMQTPAAQPNQQMNQMESMSDSASKPTDEAQARAAATFAAKAKLGTAAKSVALTPLNQRERVIQLLDRFSYGARPGEVDRVMAEGGSKWFEQQLNPGAIKDGALDVRLKAYPTLTMSAGEVSMVFPFFGQVGDVAEGKLPYPSDPLLNAVYEVQVYKRAESQDRKDVNGKVIPKPELTDAEVAARKAKDKRTASRIAGELFALPKNQRMAALIQMPVEDIIAFTGGDNLSGDQRTLLMNDFTPREQEAFEAMSPYIASSGEIVNEMSQARMLRDVLSERQLEQVMTNFWFNHFNIYNGKDADQWYTESYERDVIRKHALGTFKDLLMATAESPAMMVYLDNWLSIGPDSMANGVYPDKPGSKKGSKGLNENYGREVMELHTLSVNGGYTQADVTALSAILTGWGVGPVTVGAGFVFDPKRHEPGPKYWLGYKIDDDGTVTKLPADTPMPKQTFGPSNVAANDDSIKQGIAALNILADSPQTAHFISLLLAQYFVADVPPASLVDKLTKTYLASNGDIKTLLRTLVASPEFNSKQYFHNKVKTPEEFIASAFRTTVTDPTRPSLLVGTIANMGEHLYYALPPTGYYLTAEQWMNSVALVDRLNFAYSLTNGKFNGQPFDAPKLLAMGLMTPSGNSEVIASAKSVSTTPDPKSGKEKLIGFAPQPSKAAPDAHAPVPSGTQVTLRVMEQTMIGSPASNQTNELINKQLELQPAGATTLDTLNLLTALVMGSPEFQTR